MTDKKKGFYTRSVHAGQEPDPATGSRAVPLYQTTSYVFDSTQHGENLFNLSESGNIYSRIMNPTTDVFEKRMADLEGGLAALATASGSAAITYAIMNVAGAGDNIVSSSKLYGGTYNLLANTLPDYGITTIFADPDDPASFSAATNEKTKAWFVESIDNPNSHVPDLAALAEAAHAHGVPLFVDNTFATPYLLRPIEHGADVIIHSATKFIGGHGTSIGGVMVDAGRFDYSSGRFPMLSQPDPGYHGLSYTKDIGAAAFIIRARVKLLRDMGAALSPFHAWLFLQGLETLPLRVARHSDNAMKVAAWLAQHEDVSWVSYPGLPKDPYYKVASQYLKNGFGSIFTFGHKRGIKAARATIDALTLFSHLANVADAKSLVIHPASTTHSQLSELEMVRAGVKPETIRLSIGIEDPEDLIDDLEQALRKAKELI